MGGGNLERLMVCLKRKRVLMGRAHSLWILRTSQSVTGGGGELRVCGVNREEERESDKNEFNPSSRGQALQMSWPLGREAHRWLSRIF